MRELFVTVMAVWAGAALAHLVNGATGATVATALAGSIFVPMGYCIGCRAASRRSTPTEEA